MNGNVLEPTGFEGKKQKAYPGKSMLFEGTVKF